MKILTKSKKTDITKRLAVIYFTAIHWRSESWESFVKCICENIVEIAWAVGGERMAAIEIPAYVQLLEEARRNGYLEFRGEQEADT